MTLNNIKHSILDSAQSADFIKFLKQIRNVSEHNFQWKDIHTEKSYDTAIHLAAQSGCVKIIK